jgi:hypothetical protein
MFSLKKARKKPEFSPVLFWDTNIETIDYDREIRFVLERVFERGIENDEKEALRYYGINKIKKTALKIGYLNKPTLAYLSAVLNIPERRFKCYKKTQSVNPFGIPYFSVLRG